MPPSDAAALLEERLASLIAQGTGADALLDEISAAPRVRADEAIARLHGRDLLAPLFGAVIERGRYEELRALLAADDTTDSPGLRALAAARPGWGEETDNAPAARLLRDLQQGGSPGARYAFLVLIVPGYTPLDAREPVALSDVGRARCDLARYHYQSGRAAALLVSGGAVHPSGTPFSEGVEMRRHLIESGVPEERVLVDPYARHSTTNLRNAGRLLLDLGIRGAGIVTGGESRAFAQDFYFAHPVLSTFHARCRAELGYEVGRLESAGDYLIAFEPSEAVRRPLWSDPLDV